MSVNRRSINVMTQPVGRRSLAKGVLWSVPAVAVATVAPAFAASGCPNGTSVVTPDDRGSFAPNFLRGYVQRLIGDPVLPKTGTSAAEVGFSVEPDNTGQWNQAMPIALAGEKIQLFFNMWYSGVEKPVDATYVSLNVAGTDFISVDTTRVDPSDLDPLNTGANANGTVSSVWVIGVVVTLTITKDIYLKDLPGWDPSSNYYELKIGDLVPTSDAVQTPEYLAQHPRGGSIQWMTPARYTTPETATKVQDATGCTTYSYNSVPWVGGQTYAFYGS